MWCRAVKFGGDSGAVQQVSDIGGGFGRVPFTARSRRCHGIDVKREIISAALREGRRGDAPAASAGAASGRWPPAECAGSPRLRANFRSFAAPILPALIERRAKFAALARDFERAEKPFCGWLRICAREEPCASATAEHAITRWRTAMTLRARSFIAAVALLAFTLVGSSAFGQTRTLYDRLGGYGAIAAVVDDFVKNVAADKRINKFFANANIDRLKARLVEQICQGTGGPCVYTGRDMKSVHAGMGIRGKDFDALVQDLAKSLNKFKVPAREQKQLVAILAPMKKDIVTR